MSKLFPDTLPEAERVQIELLRRAPPWRKLEMVGQVNEIVRTLALSGLRQRYPDASPEELRRLLADLLLGRGLATRVLAPWWSGSSWSNLPNPYQHLAGRTIGPGIIRDSLEWNGLSRRWGRLIQLAVPV